MHMEKILRERKLENMGSKGANSLPEELMMEIMRRLPVNSLFRFKSVCKNWYDLIQNPNFIYNHYNHPSNHTRLLLHHHLFKLIMLDPKSEVRYRICASEFSLLSNETLLNTIPKDMVNPQTHCDDQLFNIIGPVNGLFFMYYDNQLALWNPATTEFRVLPLPRDFDFCYHSRFGFGLDPLTGDFKVVCIPYVRGGDGLGLIVQLYSLANDSWRRIDSVSASSLAHICTEVWHTRYLNGAYYWLSCTRPGPTVVKFDMGTEVFQEIQTPPSFKSESLTTYNEEVGRLVLFNNSIALLENHYSNDDIIESIDVWVMKEDECWTKHSIVGLPPIPFFRPLGFWTNGELLFHENDGTGGHTPDSELVLYNPNNRNIQVLGNCTEVLNYKASLASVKGGSKFCQTSYGSTSNNKKRKRTALTEERY